MAAAQGPGGKPKMKRDAQSGMQSVVDSIYKMYEDQAMAGTLGTKAQVSMQAKKKRDKSPF